MNHTSIKSIIKKIKNDKISEFASSASYYILLSFLPFLLVLLSIVKFFPITEDQLIVMLNHIIPNQLYDLILGIIEDIYINSTTTLTLITALTLLWSSGKGFMSIIKGLNKIYENKKNNNWLIFRIASSIYALFFMLSIMASLMLSVFSQNIIKLAHKSFPQLIYITSIFEALVNAKLLIFPAILTIVFTLMYTFVSKRSLRFWNEVPGAAFASVGWYLFSELYSFYVSHSPNYSYIYGSLTTFIFALIWVYACILIIFIGAEINNIIYHTFENK